MVLAGELEDPSLEALLKNRYFHEFMGVYVSIFGDDVRYSIIKFLCTRRSASGREIARNVGMSHKNVAKYLEDMTKKGVLEVSYEGHNIRLYVISPRAAILEKLFR